MVLRGVKKSVKCNNDNNHNEKLKIVLPVKLFENANLATFFVFIFVGYSCLLR